ncbi:MAG: antitermination protein NusB, partial [Marinirhabdus sp.]
MLTRRHIRVKVLQSVYAFRKNETTNIEAQEKFFLHSLGQIQDLYLLMLQLLVSIRAYAEVHLEKSSKKHLASQAEKNPSHVFVNNKLLKLLAGSQSLKKHIKNKKLDYWKLDGEYVGIIFKELRERQFYQNYLQQKETSFKEDRAVVLRFYKEVIAPNDKLYDYIEDKRLTWLNDFPIVNTHIVKVLSKIKETNSGDT